MTAPMPPAAAPAGNDKTTLWGVLGIVVGFLCCPILGVVFGVLSIMEAKKAGKSNTLGIIAIVLSALSLVGWTIAGANGFMQGFRQGLDQQ